jgi:hypothetical protein
MSTQERELQDLEDFVGVIASLGDAFPAALHATRPTPTEFSLVEHAHHLADLEEEGFAVRLGRLLTEDAPRLPDFDGDRAAQERRYSERAVAEGLARFAAARRANVARLRAVSAAEWQRAGVQDGVGPIALGDLPGKMVAHDCAHAREIDALFGALTPDAPVPARLRALSAQGGPCGARD